MIGPKKFIFMRILWLMTIPLLPLKFFTLFLRFTQTFFVWGCNFKMSPWFCFVLVYIYNWNSRISQQTSYNFLLSDILIGLSLECGAWKVSWNFETLWKNFPTKVTYRYMYEFGKMWQFVEIFDQNSTNF